MCVCVCSYCKTVQMYGGMRGIRGLVTETSLLDPEEVGNNSGTKHTCSLHLALFMQGIRFRGYSIPELQEQLPKTSDSGEPLPEGIFFLMLTGQIPTPGQVCTFVLFTAALHSLCQVEALSADWAARADLPQHVVQMVANFPSSLHPMSQFSSAITAMQLESKFARAYAEGMPKTKYWEVVVAHSFFFWH